MDTDKNSKTTHPKEMDDPASSSNLSPSITSPTKVENESIEKPDNIGANEFGRFYKLFAQ